MKYYTIKMKSADDSEWEECYEEYDWVDEANKVAVELQKDGYATEVVEHDEEDEDVEKCTWCEHRFERSDLLNTNIGKICDQCFAYIRSRGEPITVHYEG